MILCTDQHQRDPDRPITTITHGATGQWQLQSEIYKFLPARENCATRAKRGK